MKTLFLHHFFLLTIYHKDDHFRLTLKKSTQLQVVNFSFGLNFLKTSEIKFVKIKNVLIQNNK